jgi:hypothetical protein
MLLVISGSVDNSISIKTFKALNFKHGLLVKGPNISSFNVLPLIFGYGFCIERLIFLWDEFFFQGCHGWLSAASLDLGAYSQQYYGPSVFATFS